MGDYSGKRNGDEVVVSRKGSALVLRDSGNIRDRNAQFCNRIGCNGRPNSSKVTQINCSEKAKSSKPSFRPTTGKEIVGSSSKVCSATSKSRKSSVEPRKKLSSHLEIDTSETGSSQDEPEGPELISPHGNTQRDLPESDESGSSEITTSTEAGSSTATSIRSRRSFHQKSVLGNPVTLAGSPVSLASKSTGQGARGNMGRYGMRNLKCNSISDVIPSGASSSDSFLSRKKGTVKKRVCDGESSSSTRGKKMSGPLGEGQNSSSSPGISISDSRRSRGGRASRDSNAASVRTRRLLNGYPRARFVDQGFENNVPPNEGHFMIPQMSQADIPIDLNSASRSSQQFSVETSLHHPSSYSRPGSGNESLRGIRPSSPAELGNSRSLTNRESFRHHNMDGIAEVLLALERIEQDEELTYEQLLVLETNLFLNGLNFYDQHRELRLDIDNMSYEELLALGERMGNVSTALPEEALSDCLKMGVYETAPAEDAPTNLRGDPNDVKCSVCQEEYAAGDEVGRLGCEHRYHVVCIQQWLKLKNWCPICKASVAPSSTQSSPTTPPPSC